MTFDVVGAAWFVLDVSLRALAAAAAVAAVLRLLRMRAAVVLHAAWSVVLFAMLLMPVVPSIVPALPVPVPASAGGLLGAASRTQERPPGSVGSSRPALNGIDPVRSAVPGGSVRLLDEIRALGMRYLERALGLDPNLQMAKAALVTIRLGKQITDADRLANRAHEEYMRAEGAEYYKKDLALGKQHRDEAKARAEEALKTAAAHKQDPAYSAAVMTAHHVLATAALRDGDRGRALHHLQQSVKVPASERIQYAPLLMAPASEPAAERRRARASRGVPRGVCPLDDPGPRPAAHGCAGDPRGTHAVLVSVHGRS